jgi:hypothetical protein
MIQRPQNDSFIDTIIWFVGALAFIVLWIFVAPNLLQPMRTVYQATQNITYAANSTSSNITALENLYVGGFPILWLILPIAVMIIFMYLKLKPSNPYGY